MAKPRKHLAPADLNKVKRYSVKHRPSKVQVGAFGRPIKRPSAGDFFDSLPDFLKAADLKEFARLVAKARQAEKPFHLLMGAHSIKVGLSPILIDLMQRHIVTGLSLNGAGLIHDLEVAYWGATSEDVAAGLSDGSFGMVRETAELFAAVGWLAEHEQIGLGEAAGIMIESDQAPHRQLSLFASAHRLGCPITVHVGIGTDIVAQHPDFDGAQIGEGSHRDFRLLASLCSAIDSGGAVANIGSAVILPEVFLKALTVARNLRTGKGKLTAANFDMISHYRPQVNVVGRPTQAGGRGFNFTGHHEIMIPLLAWALRREIGT